MASRIYTCILVDDELLALGYMRNLCEAIPEIEVIKAYDDPQRFLDELHTLTFDFCISDIVMPGKTGLELAQQLQNKPVIFTTAHNEYAADAFDVEAIDYLRKPVQLDRLKRSIEKVIAQLEQQPKGAKWMVVTAQGKLTIKVDDIVVFSAETPDRRDKLMFLKDGVNYIIKNKSFDQLQEELPTANLIRISRGELIAAQYVQGYTGDQVFCTVPNSDGKKRSFTLSDTYKKSFLITYREFAK